MNYKGEVVLASCSTVGKCSSCVPLLIWTNLVINGHSQAGGPARTAQSPPVTLVALIFPISRDQCPDGEVLKAMHFSIQQRERKKKISECCSEWMFSLKCLRLKFDWLFETFSLQCQMEDSVYVFFFFVNFLSSDFLHFLFSIESWRKVGIVL